MKNFPRNQVTHYDTFDAFMEGIEKENVSIRNQCIEK